MEKTKTDWQRIDFNGQAALILGAIIYSILIGILGDEEFYFIVSYFVVGAWQLISFLTSLKHRKQWNKSRKVYGITLIVLAVALIPPITIFGLFGLLFLSPLMAIWYWLTCRYEIKA